MRRRPKQSDSMRPRRSSLDPTEQQMLYTHYGHRCAYCGMALGLLPHKDRHCDHRHPVASDAIGINDLPNFLPSCDVCNRLKSTDDPDTLEEMRWAVLRETERSLRKLYSLLGCIPALQDRRDTINDIYRAFKAEVRKNREAGVGATAGVTFLCETEAYAGKIRALEELYTEGAARLGVERE